MARFKVFRYRRPSLKTMVGLTAAKKRFNKTVGITALKKPMRILPNAKRRGLRRLGYYSGPMKFFRWFMRKVK